MPVPRKTLTENSLTKSGQVFDFAQKLGDDVKRVGRPSSSEEHVRTLTTCLGDANPLVRRGAAAALSGVTSPSSGVNQEKRPHGAHESSMALRLGDSDARTRVMVAYSLRRGGLQQAPEAAEQARRLVDGDPRTHKGCVEHLMRMGPAGAAALAGTLEHADTDLRRMVARALGDMGQEASAQTCVLAKYVRDEDEWVRTYATESVFQMGTPYSPNMNDLVKSFDDDTGDLDVRVSKRGQANTRRRAVQALGQRGSQAACHADAVAQLLEDNDVGVRRRAAEALGRICVDGEAEAVASHGHRLAQCLNHDNALLRTSAMEAMMQMGPSAAPLLRSFTAGLKDTDADVRRKAAEGLGRIGPEWGRKCVSDLSCLLKDSDSGCRAVAAETMLKMDRSVVAPYADQLADLMDDYAAGVRWSVAEGLAGLGPEGFKALARKLTSENMMVREVAKSHLTALGHAGYEAIVRAQIPDAPSYLEATDSPRQTPRSPQKSWHPDGAFHRRAAGDPIANQSGHSGFAEYARRGRSAR